MRNFILTICGCLFFAAGYAQEEAPATRKWFLGRWKKASETETTAPLPAAGGQSVTPQSATPVPESAEVPKAEGADLNMAVPTYNFGDVPRKGGDLVHDFVFTNDGTTPLVVTRVITSCSCLKAAFPKRPVPPGGSDVIRITYEPHKSEPGTFNKVIQVYSNSVDGRDVITVQGNSIEEGPDMKIKADGYKVKIK